MRAVNDARIAGMDLKRPLAIVGKSKMTTDKPLAFAFVQDDFCQRSNKEDLDL